MRFGQRALRKKSLALAIRQAGGAGKSLNVIGSVAPSLLGDMKFLKFPDDKVNSLFFDLEQVFYLGAKKAWLFLLLCGRASKESLVAVGRRPVFDRGARRCLDALRVVRPGWAGGIGGETGSAAGQD
jgi:hypothetical protein